MVAFDFVSKKEDGEKGARMGVHFQILFYKNEEDKEEKEVGFILHSLRFASINT